MHVFCVIIQLDNTRGIKYNALCTTKFHLCCNQNNIYKLKNEEESKSTKLKYSCKEEKQ